MDNPQSYENRDNDSRLLYQTEIFEIVFAVIIAVAVIALSVSRIVKAAYNIDITLENYFEVVSVEVEVIPPEYEYGFAVANIKIKNISSDIVNITLILRLFLTDPPLWRPDYREITAICTVERLKPGEERTFPYFVYDDASFTYQIITAEGEYGI
jgi:hypothetical protein